MRLNATNTSLRASSIGSLRSSQSDLLRDSISPEREQSRGVASKYPAGASAGGASSASEEERKGRIIMDLVKLIRQEQPHLSETEAAQLAIKYSKVL